MIIGIGTDLVAIDRIADTLDRYGARFINRCFAVEEQWDRSNKNCHPGEGRDPEQARGPGLRRDDTLCAAHYAKRWAAKEAAAKALGLGIDAGVYLRDLVVVKDARGAPHIECRNGAARVLMERGYAARDGHPGHATGVIRDLVQEQERMKVPDRPPLEGVRDDSSSVRIHLSLSDDAGFALAFVVIERV